MNRKQKFIEKLLKTLEEGGTFGDKELITKFEIMDEKLFEEALEKSKINTSEDK